VVTKRFTGVDVDLGADTDHSKLRARHPKKGHLTLTTWSNHVDTSWTLAKAKDFNRLQSQSWTDYLFGLFFAKRFDGISQLFPICAKSLASDWDAPDENQTVFCLHCLSGTIKLLIAK
jgi:hypothetical protein